MKKGNYLRMGALVGCLMMIFAGSAAAQSIQVDMDRSTDGIQATVAMGAGETVQGCVVVDGITGYRGHTLKVQILDPGAIDGDVIYSDADVAGVGTQTLTQLGLPLMVSTKLFITEPDVTTFPLEVFNFDFTLATDHTGDLLHIIYVGDSSVDSRLHRDLGVTVTGGTLLSLTPENFPVIADGGIEAGGTPPPTTPPTVPPTDTPTNTPTLTPTPTGTGLIPTWTPTPTVPIPTPTMGAQIIMDGFGGFHPQGTAPDLLNKESFYPGFDIARDFEILPDNSGVVALDGYGATLLLPFAGAGKMNLAAALSDIDRAVLPPWTPGVDQYRALVASADSMGFWVITDGGEIFGVGSVAPVGATDGLVANLGLDLTDVPDKGIDGAVDFAVVQDGNDVEAVIVLTAYGQQLVPIGDPASIGIQAAGGVVTSDGVNPPPYFGWDISRDIDLEPTGKGYMVLDGFGGIHPMGAARERYDEIFLNGPRPGEAPSAGGHVYFGWDVAEKIAYTADGQGLLMLDAFGGNHYDGTITPIYTIYFGFDIARDIEIIYSAAPSK